MNKILLEFLSRNKGTLLKHFLIYIFGLYLTNKYNLDYKMILPFLGNIGVKIIETSIHNDKVREYRNEVFRYFGGKTAERKKEDGSIITVVTRESDIHLLNMKFKDDYNFGAVFRINNGSIEDINRNNLATCFNARIIEFELLPKSNNTFYVEFGEVQETKYSKYPKGSLERLIHVLETLNLKPEYLGSQETESELAYNFTTSMNPKRIQRLLIDIEHKFGIRKGYLSFDFDNGQISFYIKKDVDKIYILDEIIGNVKVDKQLELPFVLGVDYSTGTTVISDLVDLKHLLIAGKTGSGKSCTMKCIIESLMYFNQNISWVMLDFAESALVRYEDFTNVKYLESDPSSVLDGINKILNEYDYRKALFRENKIENLQEYNKLKNDSKLPYLILAIDEANGFKTEWETVDLNPVEVKMKTILQRGRKYGIFTIHSVQQSNDKDYVKSWKTQMTRLAHLLEDYVDAGNLTTNKELQQVIPKLNTGEFYLLSESVKKMKGCLTNKRHDELFGILKGVYTDETNNMVENLETVENLGNQGNAIGNAKESQDKKACIN